MGCSLVRVVAVASAIAALSLLGIACGGRTNLLDDLDLASTDGGVSVDASSDASTKDASTFPIDAGPHACGACAMGETECAEGGVSSCTPDEKGCGEWGAVVPCNDAQTCAGPIGSVSCRVVDVRAARLIAPLSTSTVTQRQPTLHWIGGSAASVVDLCLDRACTRPLANSVAVTGTTAKVMAPLPSGWVFWRVRTGIDVTATWQFWVDKTSASTAVDTSSGTTLDVNGDGYADFLVGGDQHFLYLGNPNGTTSQQIELIAPTSAPFSGGPSNLGDINGDGYADFYVAPHVYLGGPSIDGSIWNGDAAPNRLTDFFTYAYDLKPIGDVNGDGYADLWIPSGRVWFGQATLTRANWISITNPDTSAPVSSPNYDNFGIAAAGAGDVNGDGYADFVVGAYARESDSTNASAHLYLGSAGPTADDWNAAVSTNRIDLPGLHPTDPFAGYYGLAVSGAGDLDNDGYADFVVGAIYTGTSSIGYSGTAHVYFGSPSPATADWNSTTHAQRIDLEGVAQMNELGDSMAPVGDVNGDGFDDLLVGEIDDQAVSQYGGARLYLGNASPSVAIWNGSTPSNRIDLPSPHGAYGYFAAMVAAGGDTDGDGYADFLISATGVKTAHYYRGEVVPNPTDWNGDAPPLRVDLTLPSGAFYGVLQ